MGKMRHFKVFGGGFSNGKITGNESVRFPGISKKNANAAFEMPSHNKYLLASLTKLVDISNDLHGSATINRQVI